MSSSRLEDGGYSQGALNSLIESRGQTEQSCTLRGKHANSMWSARLGINPPIGSQLRADWRRQIVLRSDPTVGSGENRGVDAIACPQVQQDLLDIVLDGGLAQIHLHSDLTVGQALG